MERLSFRGSTASRPVITGGSRARSRDMLTFHLVAGPAKPPVAIRITRPYETEEDFLASELDTLSRAGVTLVGAQQRPDGAVLEREIVLST